MSTQQQEIIGIVMILMMVMSEVKLVYCAVQQGSAAAMGRNGQYVRCGDTKGSDVRRRRITKKRASELLWYRRAANRKVE